MKKINLEQFAGGVLSEKFSRAFMQVLHNMQDVNTSSSDKRGITVNITLTQNETRDDVKADITVKTKLATPIPGKTQFFVGKDLDTGKIEFEEYGNRNTIRGQMALNLDKHDQNNEDIVDTHTGEILEGKPKKVTDFRKVISN